MTRTRRAAGPELASGQVCAMFAVDIAGYTDRDEEIQLHLRGALYEMLRTGFGGSGMPWERCQWQDRGDGALVIVPPGIPMHSLISPLPGQLRNQLRSHNRIVTEPARMQLRAAIHLGPVYRDDHGFAGEDVNLLCRLLDAQPLRRALAASGADLAMIVSDHFHDTVIRRHPSLTAPATFRPLRTLVKRTRVHAWIDVPADALQPPFSADAHNGHPARDLNPRDLNPRAACFRTPGGMAWMGHWRHLLASLAHPCRRHSPAPLPERGRMRSHPDA